MLTGEENAWRNLRDLNPSDVCRRTGAFYDGENNNYILSSFGMDFMVNPREQEIKHTHPEGEILIKKYNYFFNLSVLCYLINARDIPLSGRLIKPSNIKGGELFFRGTHVLPLDKVAEKYGNDKTEFIKRGKSFNGKILSYGDASIELLPMPHIPVTLIFWLSDEEFPARADLLFDSTCEQHVPLDILWSIAMLSVLVMA